MLFDFTTSRWVDLALTQANRTPTYPTWSHDGQSIYYTHGKREPAVFHVRISDRKAERVASLSGVKLGGTDFSFWMGLAPDDSPLVVRDMGTEEIYALDVYLP